jgi:hypothetical protein
MYRLQGCRFFLVQQTNAEKYTNYATTNTTGVIILLLLGQKQQNNNTKFFIPTFSKIYQSWHFWGIKMYHLATKIYQFKECVKKQLILFSALCLHRRQVPLLYLPLSTYVFLKKTYNTHYVS